MPLHLPSSDPDPPFSHRILSYGNLLLHFALASGGHARVRTTARHVRSHLRGSTGPAAWHGRGQHVSSRPVRQHESGHLARLAAPTSALCSGRNCLGTRPWHSDGGLWRLDVSPQQRRPACGHHPHPPPRARMAAAATPFARGTAIAIGMLFFSPFYFLISLQLIYRCGRDLLHYTILALAQEDVAGWLSHGRRVRCKSRPPSAPLFLRVI